MKQLAGLDDSTIDDKIREMTSFLETLGIFSMRDMSKTCEKKLKTNQHFTVISIGKIKDYLRKECPEVLQTFVNNDLKILENDRDKAKQKEADIKNASNKIEYLNECEKEEFKMLENEENEFRKRLHKLEDLKREAQTHAKKSDKWKKLIAEIESEITCAHQQLKINKELGEERKRHYNAKKKNMQDVFK